MKDRLKKLLSDQSGQAALEYILVTVLCILAIGAAMAAGVVSLSESQRHILSIVCLPFP